MLALVGLLAGCGGEAGVADQLADPHDTIAPAPKAPVVPGADEPGPQDPG